MVISFADKNFVTNEYGQNGVTYKDLYIFLKRLNALFCDSGILQSDRGLVCVKRGANQATLIASLLAQFRPALFIESSFKKIEIIKMTENLSCRYLLLESTLWNDIHEQLTDFTLVAEIPLLLMEKQKVLFITRAEDSKLMQHKFDETSLQWFLHTSGSTGHPKPVAISSENIEARTLAEIEVFQIKNNSLLINVLSLCHDLGLNQLLTALKTRSTIEIFSVHFAFDFLKRLQVCDYNGITGIPNIWKKIIHLAKEKKIIIKGHFYITISGGSLKQGDIIDLHAIFPQASIIKTYGQTETFRSLYEVSDPSNPTGFSGRPYSQVKVCLLSDDGISINDVKGELIHFGEGIFMGYWSTHDSDQLKLISGDLIATEYSGKIGLRTGDYFLKNNRGQYEFLGRDDDLIKINGRRFYLGEIEKCIQQLDFVTDVVVCKSELQDRIIYSEVLTAFVILNKKQYTQEDIKLHCMKYLEGFKVPSQIVIVESFPLTSTGKTDRMKLISDFEKKAKNDEN